jgi:hypothetical protein
MEQESDGKIGNNTALRVLVGVIALPMLITFVVPMTFE